MGKRIVMTVGGTLLVSVCVALIRTINWGVDPWTAFVEGFEYLTGLSYGILMIILMGILLVIIFLLDKHYLGLATLITMFVQGPVVDLLEKYFVDVYLANPNIPQKIIMMIIALFCLCFGSSLYMTSDLGVSTYDAISLILSDKRKWKYQYCRILTDVICVVVGFIFHANIGVLTIVTACCMGPLVSWMNEHWSKPIRFGRNAAAS